LAVITGNRSSCGLDRSPSSDYYLLRNDEGYWLKIQEILVLYILPSLIIRPENIEENMIYNKSEVNLMANYNGGILRK
jgi:hypothetical protein